VEAAARDLNERLIALANFENLARFRRISPGQARRDVAYLRPQNERLKRRAEGGFADLAA
jgi:hypothetical protein